jgi:hypothetical protein
MMPEKAQKGEVDLLTDLEAVLAGISTTCNVHVDTLEWDKCAPPERQRA